MNARPKALLLAYFRIFVVESAFWIISISMVFVNGFVLNSDVLTDDLTIFITIFQLIFSLTILVTLDFITRTFIFPQKLTKRHDGSDSEQKSRPKYKLIDQNDNVSNSEIEFDLRDEYVKEEEEELSSKDMQDSLLQLIVVSIPHRINLNTCQKVFSLSIMYVGMLLLNNFCLKNVGIASYFISRSLTTVFNVIFTYFILKEPVGKDALICCLFIVFGFILGIDQESVIGSLSLLGVCYGVASSLFTSLFSIYTKKTLAKVDGSIWTLVMYNYINAIALCTPLVLVHGDIQVLISDKVVSPIFWSLLSISGVMAFFISIVSNASIKYTSPLTHNISGTFKACLQTVIAVVYNHEHKSFLWWTSNIVILVASASYSRIRQIEMERRANETQERNASPKYHYISNVKDAWTSQNNCDEIDENSLKVTSKI